ncbi:unnamed protein product [Durusdinium trenchii]|uniref:RNA pseudouridylate synthase domain-containing protein 1 n=2 Tax=Durusdinium trenchii TaxID=1381693 RepID=A0ABP0JY98_9DINO
MGYFIQITNDSGRPIFQASKNYPDVSFASSALFHALITASLEQGFVPSILRADDAIIALEVHGDQGARLGLAMVTSELAAGKTSDLQARASRRLDALYQGARLILGNELHKAATGQTQAEAVRRILLERLTPMVSQLMADEEESADEPLGYGFFSDHVPQIMWPPPLGLRLSGAAVEWLPLNCSSLGEHALEELLAHFSPEHLHEFAESAQPPRPPAVLFWRGRVIAATPAWRRFMSVDRALLVAMANGVGPSAFGEAARSLTLEEVDDLWVRFRASGDSSTEELQHQMLSLRLYPDQRYIPPELHESIGDARQREDASLVLSVLAPVQVCKDLRITLPRLRENALDCAKQGSLPFLWQKLLGRTEEPLLRLGKLSVAILLDENSGDVVAFPALTSRSKNVGEISTGLRRTVYWFHVLPPLSASCSQRFVCCEGFVIAAARREDGILCWACSTDVQGDALKEVLRLLKHLPRAPGLWSALGALEAP